MHGPLNVSSLSIQFPSVDWSKSQHWITTADAPTKIRTECLPNTGLYHFAAPSRSISEVTLQKPSCLYEAKGHKNHCLRLEEIYGTGGTDPLIHNLANKWKLFMSFTSWPLNTWGKRLGALRQSGPLGKKKNSLVTAGNWTTIPQSFSP